MRVLLASQYFTPEVTAAAARVDAFAAGLAARGHEVEVIAELPSHPEGELHQGFARRRVVRRERRGFRVSHVWVHISPSKRASSRVANYASYAASAFIEGASMRRPDAVVASSPPLPAGWLGSALALRHRVPWVLDVRDLWPDAAVAVGELREDGAAARAAARLERRLYRSAAAITTVTRPFAATIAARGGAGKIEVIPNGTTDAYLDVGRSEPAAGAREQLLRRHGVESGEFVWTYAGNLGLAQGLDAAVSAAGELGAGFRLVVVGSGPLRSRLREQATSVAGNVSFADAVPAAEAARLMRASDALLVPLAAEPRLEDFVPSKLFDCCAVGRPVIVAARGEAKRLAEEAGAAVATAPGDAGGIAAAVRRLAADDALRERLARAGREFAARNRRDRGVEELERVIRRVSSPNR